MTADEIAKRPTPLTDAFLLTQMRGMTSLSQADHARRLEQDRAALMEALETARDGMINLRPESGPMERQFTKHIKALDETIAAVRERNG